MSRRPAIALWLTVATAVLLVAGLPLAAATHQFSGGGIVQFAILLPFAAVGGVVARRRPDNPIGWLMLGTAFIGAVSDIAGWYAVLAYHYGHPGLTLARLGVVLAPIGWFVLLLIAPDRDPALSERPAAHATLALAALRVPRDLGAGDRLGHDRELPLARERREADDRLDGGARRSSTTRPASTGTSSGSPCPATECLRLVRRRSGARVPAVAGRASTAAEVADDRRWPLASSG